MSDTIRELRYLVECWEEGSRIARADMLAPYMSALLDIAEAAQRRQEVRREYFLAMNGDAETWLRNQLHGELEAAEAVEVAALSRLDRLTEETLGDSDRG